MTALLEPIAPYEPPPPVEAKPCRECGADLMRERHLASCPELGEIRRLALDLEGRRLEDLLATATRRAWRSWTRAGCAFPGTRRVA